MTNWTTECTYCSDEIEVEDPSEVTKLGGEPIHGGCAEERKDALEPDLPAYCDVEFSQENVGFIPEHVQDIFKPFRVVIGEAERPTEVSGNRVSQAVWDLGHLTAVTFYIDEDWNVEPVAVNGKKVTDERFRKCEHDP